jgi:predicted nucleic acid-binding Zn ribbon protein
MSTQKKPKTMQITVTRTIPLEPKQCPICGKAFDAPKIRTYCSVACQMKANYARHSAQYLATKREKYQAAKKAAKRTAGKK